MLRIQSEALSIVGQAATSTLVTSFRKLVNKEDSVVVFGSLIPAIDTIRIKEYHCPRRGTIAESTQRLLRHHVPYQPSLWPLQHGPDP
jgi:hypothetical protein